MTCKNCIYLIYHEPAKHPPSKFSGYATAVVVLMVTCGWNKTSCLAVQSLISDTVGRPLQRRWQTSTKLILLQTIQMASAPGYQK